MNVKVIKTVFCVFILALLFPVACEAKFFGKKPQKEEVDIYELSIDENISTPELGKQSKKIIPFQEKEEQYLKKYAEENGYPCDIERIRNKEVIMITVPARCLFKPNETILSDNGKEMLRVFLRYLNEKRLYKMVLAMHSDNTGNDVYTLDLTTKRVNSVYDWMGETDKSKTDRVVPYALGGNDPVVDNNSVENRDKNRRLVIYLIPDNAMINQAKRGKIVL